MTRLELKPRFNSILNHIIKIKNLTNNENSEFFHSAALFAELARETTKACDLGIIDESEAISILTKVANIQDQLIIIEYERIKNGKI
jgi:hypothetical protein